MTGYNYDEYLLFKYVLIKAIAHGKMFPVGVDASSPSNYTKAFRGYSNAITFMNTKYNASGVTTNTEKEDQYIFMDAMFNAEQDVDVLANAFNMEKAEFLGKVELIDDFTSFDNERFSEIRANSDMIEEVTAAELELCKKVKAILVDQEWFQFYDNNLKMTEVYVSSGDYWNYNLNVYKTISSSPFSNAIVFVDNSADITPPATITLTVADKSVSENATVLTLELDDDTASLVGGNLNFIQDETSTAAGIAIHRYGAIIYPSGGGSVTLKAEAPNASYTSSAAVVNTANVGDTVTMNKDS